MKRVLNTLSDAGYYQIGMFGTETRITKASLSLIQKATINTHPQPSHNFVNFRIRKPMVF